jgi:hypothetical protein
MPNNNYGMSQMQIHTADDQAKNRVRAFVQLRNEFEAIPVPGL